MESMEKEKVFRGAISIIYKKENGQLLFLVAENAKTGNISFVSGAEEDEDGLSLEKTAQREIKEELGIDLESYKLIPTEVKHEFIFGPKKVERAGKKGSYSVFLAEIADLDDTIGHTTELKSAKWMTKEEVLNSLTFPELKEIFEKAISSIK